MMKLVGLVVVLAAAAMAPFAATAFSTLSSSSSTSCRRPPSSSTAISYSSSTSSSRRDLLAQTITSAILIITTIIPAAAAATTTATGGGGGGGPPTKAEIERIQTGYNNIQYLLANWEAETTVCKANGGQQCERNADACRRYLGLRSTTDPLFQIEKVFAKVRFIEDIDPDKLDAFFEATEDWNTAMNMTNSMSFISQFAEYNPGGGKDEVLKYLNEAQTQVILAEKALKTILDCINSSSSSSSSTLA